MGRLAPARCIHINIFRLGKGKVRSKRRHSQSHSYIGKVHIEIFSAHHRGGDKVAGDRSNGDTTVGDTCHVLDRKQGQDSTE